MEAARFNLEPPGRKASGEKGTREAEKPALEAGQEGQGEEEKEGRARKPRAAREGQKEGKRAGRAADPRTRGGEQERRGGSRGPEERPGLGADTIRQQRIQR